ncbi:MAG: hypothetical protein KBA87_02365 [Lachnospiraceae bacterium]|nr:hypothetical protein [Lachnospiraceae bacterium]
MYPILTIVFIGIIIFTIRRIYVKNKEHSTEQSFWDREQKANLTSKADITNLSYITIPMEKFPLETTDFQDEKLIESLKALSEKRILCLNGFTNTDLKEKYGVSNLTALNEIGENFNSLCAVLISLAENSISRADYISAEKYLEYGAAIRSDVSKNYILLGNCYRALNKPRKITSLIEFAPTLHLPLERLVISSLNDDFEKLTLGSSDALSISAPGSDSENSDITSPPEADSEDHDQSFLDDNNEEKNGESK